MEEHIKGLKILTNFILLWYNNKDYWFVLSFIPILIILYLQGDTHKMREKNK